MKKTKIVIINIVIFLLFVLILEFTIFELMSKKEFNNKKYSRNFVSAYTYMPIKAFKEWFTEQKKYKFPEDTSQTDSNILKRNLNFRDNLYENSKKRPILFLGCSYTWGATLTKEENFSGLISKSTKRDCYNRAIPGWGTQHALYMLKNGLLSNLPKTPEYIIYTFIDDHVRRLYTECCFFDSILFFYKNENSKLEEKTDKDLLFWHTYTTRYLFRKYFEKKYKEKDNAGFLLLHLLEINKEIKKQSKKTKFIIFSYEDGEILKQIEPELIKEDITVIYLKDLTNINIYEKKYINDEAKHPSALAWKIIVPLFIKKLKL